MSAAPVPSRARALVHLVATIARAEPRRMAIATFLLTAGNASMLLVAYAIKLVVDAVASGDRDRIPVAGAVLAVGILTNLAATYPIATVGMTLRERATHAIEQRVVELTAGIPDIEHHERPEYLDRVQLLLRSNFSLAEAVSSVFDSLWTIVLLLSTTALLASVHPLLVLLPVAALPALYAGLVKDRIVVAWDERMGPLWRLKKGLRDDVAWQAADGPELRLFGAAANVLRRQQEAAAAIIRSKARLQVRLALVQTSGDLFLSAAQVAALAFVAIRVLRGELDPGDVVLVVVLGRRVDSDVADTISNLRYLYSLLVVIGRLQWLERHADATRVVVGNGEVAAVPSSLSDGIAVEGARFTYPSTSVEVLRGIDLHLPAGAIVALVGENGAGKTTLVKLLTRMYSPDGGRISVDGVDLSSFDVDAWRARTTAAFQDFGRLELPVREAVAFAASDDDALVGEALDAAGLGGVLGLDDRLGRRFPGGNEPSGGEWQKVAIARALVRRSPLLFVLDEPTAALDPQAEHDLFETARRAAAANPARGVTVFVSHRFSTVRLADLVVVIEDGVVAEQGTHDELIARRGRYATLFERQARAYR